MYISQRINNFAFEYQNYHFIKVLQTIKHSTVFSCILKINYITLHLHYVVYFM